MANIYVRKSGSDSNDGSTPALAKLTIEAAYAALSAGDQIIVGAGIYNFTTVISGSKYFDLLGDITGEYTGDAGEVILTGINSTFTAYTNFSSDPFIETTSNIISNIKNIIFQHILVENYILNGLFNLENVDFINCYTAKSGYLIRVFDEHANNPHYFKNVSISDCSSSKMFYIELGAGRTQTINFENISCEKNKATYGAINIGTREGSYTTVNILNCNFEGINKTGYGITLSGYASTGSVIFSIKNTNISYFSRPAALNPTGGYTYTGNAYNCNIFNNANSPDWSNISTSGLIAKANFTIPKIYPISRFSPLIGQAYSSYATKDIEENPRPAYGNANANIGISESTNRDIQQESTIKDSGDYSIKVAPCNMFKRVFQIPVTASTLRTVKVKIRIDGTWGTYRPRISLSGQGMTLNTATKDATTGSFEELTVSGTPTTTGIALLTVEAHSTSTDAIMYLDTITVE